MQNTSDSTQLRGRTEPWGLAGALVLVACVLVGLWLRLRGLGVDGFAGDEVHKWQAAQRYLHGDFGGDDVEHPMLMKSLVTLAVLAFRGILNPEAITRLPNAIAGGLTVWATALLGRRLFGRGPALVGAALMAVCTTAVGYHRVAKEDTLLTLFFVLCIWCFIEAKAAADDGRGADQRRWELWSAVALGAAFASKYFIFYFPIPVLSYLWLRPVSVWRVPLRRWLSLIGLALLVFFALNWSPLLPGTADYMVHYIRGDVVGVDRSVSESILFMGKLYGNMAVRGDASPWWFFFAFAGIKFAPLTAALGAVGLALALWKRAPAHRVVLVWLGIFQAFAIVAGAKYGRFFESAMPVFLLLVAHGADTLVRWIVSSARSAARAPEGAAIQKRHVGLALAALLLVVPETSTALAHAPHYRLYLNALGGGDENVNWFLPHCDYFDAGAREAIAWIAQHAEPGAEVSTEVERTVRLYAEWYGRPDLVTSPILPGQGCSLGKPCYVIVMAGRIYRHNEAALDALASKRPVHVELIRGHEAVRVYRLAPAEPLFPPALPVSRERQPPLILGVDHGVAAGDARDRSR